jgi:hypothetical protein
MFFASASFQIPFIRINDRVTKGMLVFLILGEKPPPFAATAGRTAVFQPLQPWKLPPEHQEIGYSKVLGYIDK